MNATRISYPRRIKLANIPTPLEPLRFSQLPAGSCIYIKRDDLTGSVTTGNKIRKLEFLLADARQKGCDTVITCGGVQSNHARATALAAASVGMKCVLFLRGNSDSVNEANLLLNHIAGADIRFITSSDYVNSRDQIMEDCAEGLRRENGKPYTICEGGSNAIGTWGYVRAMEEMYRQVKRQGLKVDGIVAAVGSGGTHSGLLLGAKLLNWKVPIYGINICDDRPHFEARIGREICETIEKYGLKASLHRRGIHIIDGYVGEGYGVAPMPVHDLIQCLALETGIVLDPVYTGKAFYGMIQEIGKGAFGRRPGMIFVHTGGVFGLLTQKFAGFYRR